LDAAIALGQATQLDFLKAQTDWLSVRVGKATCFPSSSRRLAADRRPSPSISSTRSWKATPTPRSRATVTAAKQEFAGLRTGRASPHLLDPINVEAYGQRMSISQLGTVSTPEPRLLTVQIWDKSMVKQVDKAIRDGGLGLNPQVDGQLLRIPIPPLNEERRKELVKHAHKSAEAGRIAIRNIRRDGMELLKRLEKDHKIGQDEQHRHGDELQKLTDGHIKDVDDALAVKEKEIMQV